MNTSAGTRKIVFGVNIQGFTGESTTLNSAFDFRFLDSKISSESQYVSKIDQGSVKSRSMLAELGFQIIKA